MRVLLIALAAGFALAAPAHAQQDPQAPARNAAQRAAMEKLAFLDGEWRGPSRVLTGPNQWRDMIQAERVGPMLDGTVRVLEGRGFTPDGAPNFNAFAVISFEPDTGVYSMRSYQGSRVGDFPIEVVPNGFRWTLEAGPGVTIRYEAWREGDVWKEVGYRIVNGGAPVKFYEFTVTRLRDSSWPLAGQVGPR